MNDKSEPRCRWCGAVIINHKQKQKFCCPSHRYLFHKNQLISPSKLEERVREIVREELRKHSDEIARRCSEPKEAENC